jgi:predicted amidohydrolase YtcJ
MPVIPHSQSLSADGVIRARRILTLTSSARADAIWWQDGRVRMVGPAEQVDRQAPASVPRYDLPGALVTPGFVDGHTHFLMWALNRRRVQLAGAATRAEAVTRVAGAVPVQGWVLGQGWDANSWRDAPERSVLDAVQPGPVYLDSLDVHAAWLNSAALAAAGIGRHTPDPFGGRIVRDAAGEPTGLLLERAVELAKPCLPEPPDDIALDAMREAQAAAHRLGITGIHNVEGDQAYRAFERMEAEGGLGLRVLFHPPVADLPRLLAAGVRSGQGSGRLSIGGIKLFLDGSLGSRTAWMLEPYSGSRDRGMPITGIDDAQAAMRLAAEAGIAVTAHAIGDAAVRRALDLIEPLPRAAIPHSIEHFQCVHPSDVGRAARAGIVASMQPAHLLTDIPLVQRHWGGREAGAYAFRTLAEAGTTLVFGSDVPVASIDPRPGLFASLRRHGLGEPAGASLRPEERIGFDEAVEAYTVMPAVAGGVAARRGRLAAGQDADLVAWEVDPEVDQGSAAAFLNARAVLTVVGGAVVHQG